MTSNKITDIPSLCYQVTEIILYVPQGIVRQYQISNKGTKTADMTWFFQTHYLKN